MFCIIRGPSDELELQRDLNRLASWAADRKLKFNPLKSVHVRFSARRAASPAPAYLLGTSTIPQKDKVKYLGLHLDSQLNWKHYADQIVRKVNKRVRYLNSLFPPSCQRARLVLLRSLVLPLYDYCAAVVHPHLKSLKDAMEKTVNTFLRSVNLGEPQDSSTEEKYCSRLMQLGMEPLVIRRHKSALLLAYKLIFERIPFGNTRNAHQRLQHPHPVQAVKKSATMSACTGIVTLGPVSAHGRTRGPAEGTFVYIVQRISNDLPFDGSAYTSLHTFQAALHALDWNSLPFVAKVLSESFCSNWRNEVRI